MSWSEQLVLTIGARLRLVRKAAKMSARELSERTAELGYQVPPSIIAKLDTGHRGDNLQLHELLILCAALDVSPASVIFPNVDDSMVEMLPGVDARSDSAHQWLTAGLDGSEPDPTPITVAARAHSVAADLESAAANLRRMYPEGVVT